MPGIALFLEESFPLLPTIVYHGHPIATKKTDTIKYPNPKKSYLIYLRPNQDTTWTIIQLSDIITTSLQATEEELFDIAKKDDFQNPKVAAIGFDDIIIWEEPTYLTLVLDAPVGYDWLWNAATGFEPITFLKNQPITTLGAKPYDENYSFYNAKASTVRNCHAVQLANYLKGDAAGNDLKTPLDIRKYCMQFNMIAPVNHAGPKGLVWDPDSENQGPGGVGPL